MAGIFTSVAASQVVFPEQRPINGSFSRPIDGAAVDVSPPGFCWWRAAPRGKVHYRLSIRNSAGQVVYRSPQLADPVYAPAKVLPAGDYSWTVEALVGETVAATLGPRTFQIADDALSLPWVPPRDLLKRVPDAHPRLLFPAGQREEFRATLESTRKQAYEDLRAIAEQALTLPLMPKPTFDRFDRETQYADRRVDYRKAYHEFTRVYHRGMLPMAAIYVLSGERRFGEAAKAHLLNLLDWEVDGIASLESGFDEIGLRIQRTAAQGYDWLYDILTPTERDQVKQMLIAHGNAMLARLKQRDFLNYSAYSHDGRLPGYLIEFSIALAEEPVAEEWMEYALTTLLTVFPHWAGADGGWAEGINYALSYNDRFITPLQSLYVATGYDLWKKPFFRKFRHFVMYNVSPYGEVLPFGDGEQKAVASRSEQMSAILLFHALRYQDPQTRWWIDLLPPRGRFGDDRLGALHRLVLPDTVAPKAPEHLPLDRAFRGVGWAALHTDLANPQDDLMVMFKSSPFGSISHSHADQNTFVIMKGGNALAIPGGERFPQHGSPFHEQYTQQTVAHNALLIDGKGQRNRDETARGAIVDFRSMAHLAYVAGEASTCYDIPLKKYVRHVVLVRPSLIIVLDDLEADRPIELSWLMHTKEESAISPDNRTFVVARHDLTMTVHLAATTPLVVSQTDTWPLPPKQGYPMVEVPDPPRQWHLEAKTTAVSLAPRAAAVMAVGDQSQNPTCAVSQTDGLMVARADLPQGQVIVEIRLDASKPGQLLSVQFSPHRGEVESLTIP